MMRQSAAFQIGLDLDDEPWLRWRVLNAAAPYVTAIFANSPLYDGEPTGHRSTRAAVWRALDPARTGLPGRRTIRCGVIWTSRSPRRRCSSRPWPASTGASASGSGRAEPTAEEWHEHLSTLFPEVRPRGHFELRSCDGLPPRFYAAPLALAVGITYDPGALRAAADLLGPPDAALLERAGRTGLAAPDIARVAGDLVDIALRGCADLGPGYFHPTDLDQARAFFDCYTRRGRSPADDLDEAVRAA